MQEERKQTLAHCLVEGEVGPWAAGALVCSCYNPPPPPKEGSSNACRFARRGTHTPEWRRCRPSRTPTAGHKLLQPTAESYQSYPEAPTTPATNKTSLQRAK